MKYIDKKCECCGEMMRDVSYLRKYCEKCQRVMKNGRGRRCYARKKKKELKPKANFGDVSQCKTCRFRGHLPSSPVICCDYTEITGQARLCNPSPDCTKYEEGNARVVQPSAISIRG